MATSASAPARPPLQEAARLANIWGWSYILTILGAFGAWSVPPGALRVLLLNFGVLCFVIGLLELYWRKKLLATGSARWVKILALNEVFGTLALFWSLHLLYQVPETLLNQYAQHSELWTRTLPLMRKLPNGDMLTESYILGIWHTTKVLAVYGLGTILFLSQVWVIRRYLALAKKISAASSLPPVIK